MLDHEQPPRVYREPWPPYSPDPLEQGRAIAPLPDWDGPRHGKPHKRLWLWLALMAVVAGIAAVVPVCGPTRRKWSIMHL
jgi:hypothetical protein